MPRFKVTLSVCHFAEVEIEAPDAQTAVLIAERRTPLPEGEVEPERQVVLRTAPFACGIARAKWVGPDQPPEWIQLPF